MLALFLIKCSWLRIFWCMLRGSGLFWDLRLTSPYENYNLFKFSVPLGKVGDCFDRYLIRLSEMRESLTLMHHVCNIYNSLILILILLLW
jgi:NADH:ubiquinone oxidoreductase subunit D